MERKRYNNSARNMTTLLLVVVILILAVIIILLLSYMSGFGMMNGMTGMMGVFGGMMNGNYDGMMGGIGSFSNKIGISTATSYSNNLPKYMQRYIDNDTLIFNSSNITLIILAMDVQRAINLTHEQPPAYDSNSSGNAFVVYGLINPTIIVPKGAIVHVEFVNLDSGANDYHNVIMTATGPVYQYMPMSAMNGIVSMMPIIPSADYSNGSASEYNYTTVFEKSGAYWYLCMYPGHAQMGMYGKMIVI